MGGGIYAPVTAESCGNDDVGVYESKWVAGLALAGSGHQLVGHAQEQQQEKRITALQYRFQCCAIMGGGCFGMSAISYAQCLLQRGIRSLASR